MSIQSEIDRIKANVSDTYAAVAEMGGILPEEQNSDNLAGAVMSIPKGGGSAPLDPVEVYKATRPADWLPMPEPQDDEMYLLFHIPDGVSSLLAFTVTCTGSYTVATGTVENGTFVQSGAVSIASGQKYEAELFADDFGDLTSTGMKQCIVKVSGTDILTWEPSVHSRKTSPSNFAGWNIVEISCNLPNGTKVTCGSSTTSMSLMAMRYFSWYGKNNATIMSNMFIGCYSLTSVPQLDTAKATNMSGMFNGCYSLTSVPQMDTAKATNMSYMFSGCRSLTSVPQMDTASATSMSYMLNDCRSLTVVPQLDTAKATTMSGMFNSCYSLEKITLNPAVTGWAGYDISLVDCSLSHQALVDLFNSLPTITGSIALALTGNPGVSELTDEEKAIVAEKNWMLTL